jgi:AraC-like DNA-binding protein
MRYLVSRRMERAASLLRTTDRNVGDICFMVGLRSIGSFTSAFGRAFGVPPLAYRATHPPASERALIPSCVVSAWTRPIPRSLGEDTATPGG